MLESSISYHWEPDRTVNVEVIASTAMLITAIVAFFKFKVVGNIIILACWPVSEQIKLIRLFSSHGMRAVFSCDPYILGSINRQLQGVLYINDHNNLPLQKVHQNNFSIWYKWLVIGDEVPPLLDHVRYDADVVFMKPRVQKEEETTVVTGNGTINIMDKDNELHSLLLTSQEAYEVHLKDVYIHPREGVSLHPWASWTSSNGFQLKYETERIWRRQNLENYPLRIATPLGHFAQGLYNGTFLEYLMDISRPELDPTIRCTYNAAILITETLNASNVLVPALKWATKDDNTSMLTMVKDDAADISGSILRPLHDRMRVLDYVMPLWPFRVGFTYLGERDSSSNMFVEPFSPGVWWATLVTALVLVLIQRLTARNPVERDGATYTVLATFLQQDASAVPEGASGRWTFTVLSLWAMLLHAYYTSAIVSALMSAGTSGPETLRALADSRYAIASEDVDYMRYLMFDRNSNWTEMEYLKEKKMTANLYQPIERGITLIQKGSTAFHSEYQNIYPLLRTFSDDQLCKLSHVDTIPESLTWIVSTKRSQYTDILRVASGRIHEAGIAKRLLSHWRMKPGACRASLLAERVKFGDVSLLIGISSLGLLFSLVLLAAEVFTAKWCVKEKNKRRSSAQSNVTDETIQEVVDFMH